MRVSAKTKVCVIIGDPVEHSLSPQMHNASYEALGIDNEFVFTAARVTATDTAEAVQAMRTLQFCGMTCTMPHKIHIINYLDAIDPVAKKIGAVNTVVNDNGKLTGYNTDWLGVVTPLEKYGTLQGKRVAIIGAGGAARAAIFGLTKHESEVTIFNRTPDHAENLVNEFGGIVRTLDDIAEIKDMDIIFNTVPLGNESIIPIEYLSKNQIVFDALYFPYETALLKNAKEKGATIIHGTEMLLYQGTEQFSLYTKQKAPENIMRDIIMKNIQVS